MNERISTLCLYTERRQRDLEDAETDLAAQKTDRKEKDDVITVRVCRK